MVAVHRLTDRRFVARPVAADRAAARGTARPNLRVIEGGASSRSVTTTPTTVLAVAAIMATLTLVVLVRGVQGAPPAADWNTLAGDTPVPAAVALDGSAVATFTVGPDDTWATIAAEVAPGADPVDVARRLAGVNGGYALRPGQVLTTSLQR